MIVIDNRASNAGSFGQLPKNPTWEQVQALFKLAINETKGWAVTPAGQACWRFIGVTLQEGPAVYRLEVRDKDGAPYPGILVARNYSSAPTFPAPILPAYFPNGEAGFTESGGDKLGAREFSYGGSSVTGSNGGPDSFWVSASPPGQQPQFSDLAGSFGWLGGTNHFNPSPIFQYVVKGEIPPSGEYFLKVVVAGQVVGKIPIQPISTGENFLALFQGTTELGRVLIE